MFSFIIPTLNEEKYIGPCLSSIACQTRKDFEIIVVDSYSKDKTVNISKKYTRNIVFCGERGPGPARNMGTKKARGNILIFADADTRFPRNFLEQLEKKWKKTNVGCVFSLGVYDANSFSCKISYKIANLIIFLMNKTGNTMTAGSCFAFTKDIFQKTGGFNTAFITNEDHDLAKRASKYGRFIYFREIRIMTSSRRIKKFGLLKSYFFYIKSSILFLLKNTYVKNYKEYWG